MEGLRGTGDRRRLVVLVASLARVGAPSEWNGNTATLFILTFAAAAPLAYAARKLPKDTE